MSKASITKTWIGGLVALAAGLLMTAVGGILLVGYGGTLSQTPGTNQYDFVPSFDGFFWSMVAVIVSGVAMAFAGGMAQIVAWIGALANSFRLADKTWFVVVLVGGLAGLVIGLVGFAAMVAYLIAAPDGARKRPAATGAATPNRLAPAS